MRRRLTQRALAARAGVSLSTVQAIEAGRSRRVRFATMEKLADVLGVEPEAIDDFAPSFRPRHRPPGRYRLSGELCAARKEDANRDGATVARQCGCVWRPPQPLFAPVDPVFARTGTPRARRPARPGLPAAPGRRAGRLLRPVRPRQRAGPGGRGRDHAGVGADGDQLPAGRARTCWAGAPCRRWPSARSTPRASRGSMRTNLVAMLDGIGVPGRSASVRLPHCSAPTAHSSTRHPSCAIRCSSVARTTPGTSHDYSVHPLLRDYAFGPFADELRRTGNALVVPLGRAVSEVLAALAECGVLPAERCLLGFPHPSGANGHRLREYTATRDEMVRQVQAWSAVSRG